MLGYECAVPPKDHIPTTLASLYRTPGRGVGTFVKIATNSIDPFYALIVAHPSPMQLHVLPVDESEDPEEAYVPGNQIDFAIRVIRFNDRNPFPTLVFIEDPTELELYFTTLGFEEHYNMAGEKKCYPLENKLL